jgi:hypothetical protein
VRCPIDVVLGTLVLLLNILSQIRPSQYLAWHSWLGGKKVAYFVGLVTIASVAVAGMCAYIAAKVDWNGPLSGVGLAIMVVGASRLDLTYKPDAAQRDDPSRNLLDIFINWLTDMMNDMTADAISNWALSEVHPELLALYTAEAYDIEGKTKKRERELLAAIRAALDPSPATSIDGRGRLANIALRSFIRIRRRRPQPSGLHRATGINGPQVGRQA